MIKTSHVFFAVALVTVGCQGKKSSSPSPNSPAPELVGPGEKPVIKPEDGKKPAAPLPGQATPGGPVVSTPTTTTPTNPTPSTSTPGTVTTAPTTTPSTTPTSTAGTTEPLKLRAEIVGTWANSLLTDSLCTTFYRFADSTATIELFCRIPGKADIGYEKHSFSVDYSAASELTLTETDTSCAQKATKPSVIRFSIAGTEASKTLTVGVRSQDVKLRQIAEESVVPLLSSLKTYKGHSIALGCFGAGRLSTFQAKN